jgi:hypothetical protein
MRAIPGIRQVLQYFEEIHYLSALGMETQIHRDIHNTHFLLFWQSVIRLVAKVQN